jgi:hypothetical protein
MPIAHGNVDGWKSDIVPVDDEKKPLEKKMANVYHHQQNMQINKKNMLMEQKKRKNTHTHTHTHFILVQIHSSGSVQCTEGQNICSSIEPACTQKKRCNMCCECKAIGLRIG